MGSFTINYLDIKGASVTLLGNFIKIQKVSWHQFNFKTNDLVLFVKTI